MTDLVTPGPGRERHTMPFCDVEVVVTAGGTSEPIDDVRAVTNFSSGRFSNALADAFVAAGASVTLAGSRLALAYRRAPETCDIVRFDSTADLAEVLARPLDRFGADPVIVHAAAVSDYRPVRAFGKLSSDIAEFDVHMVKTPKLVDDLRARHGHKAFLVGFKLLSGVTDDALVAAGHALCKRARLNLVVANDLAQLHDGNHPVWLITAEGGALRVEGTRESVARSIVDFIARRRSVTWSRTAVMPGRVPVADVDWVRFERVLSFAQDSSMLCDTNGNVSVRRAVGSGRQEIVPMLVTPRQLDKATLRGRSDACVADADLAGHTVACWGAHKCSIDTSVQAALFAALPAVSSFIHSHSCWGRADTSTTFPYPCGAAEEAEEVLRVLAGLDVAWNVELVGHGHILGLDDASLGVLEATWADVRALWLEHLAEVGFAGHSTQRVMPVLDGVRAVGVVAEDGDGLAVFLGPEARGSGIGRVVTSQLVERRRAVVTAEACEVLDFWRGRGFSGAPIRDGVWRFTPPEVRTTHHVVN